MSIFWENTSGKAVFSASWFNSKYMLLPVHVVVGTVSVYSAMLVPQWYMQCVSPGVSCWLRCTSRCVPRGFQALMPCIMAGLDQRDSYVVSQFQFIMLVQLPGWWSRRAENCGFPQLQFLSRRWHARRCARQGCGGVAGAVLIGGRRHPCLYAEADPHGPDCCLTKEVSQLLFDKVVDVPVLWPCRSSVAAVEKTAAIPQLQFVVLVPGQGRSHARCVQRQMPGGADAVAVRLNVVDAPGMQVQFLWLWTSL